MYDICSCGLVVSSPSAPLALMPPPPTAASQPIAMSRSQMQLHLTDLQQHTAELRKQLTQLRQLQVCVCVLCICKSHVSSKNCCVFR